MIKSFVIVHDLFMYFHKSFNKNLRGYNMTISSEFYSELAGNIAWYKTAHADFKEQALDKINKLAEKFPYGSGFNNGCSIDLEKSNGEKIVIKTAFHHMDENGYYDGWTEHTVIITPSLQYGFNVKVTGKNKNQIKDYIFEIFCGD
jgi:hypothetical protein